MSAVGDQLRRARALLHARRGCAPPLWGPVCGWLRRQPPRPP